MSESGQQLKGRPNTDNVETVRFLQYCGGFGAGGCIFPLGITGVVIPLRVPKYITYNRKIIILNNYLRFYTDAGSSGLCAHSIGSEVDFWMGLAADSALDIESTAKAGVNLSGALPYEIEFPANLCPQPTDPAWDNIIYVYVWWGDTSYLLPVVGGLSVDATSGLTIVKHDKDSNL